MVISELVTNAVMHGRGDIELRLAVEPGAIAGEVIDEGAGFEAEVRERGAEEVTGRGLLLVAQLAGRWGIHDGSSHVWFQMDRSRDEEDETAPPQLGDETRPEGLP